MFLVKNYIQEFQAQKKLHVKISLMVPKGKRPIRLLFSPGVGNHWDSSYSILTKEQNKVYRITIALYMCDMLHLNLKLNSVCVVLTWQK